MEDSCGHWFNIASDVNLSTIGVPGSYEEAKASRLYDKWLGAMKKEIEDLLKNRTWTPVDPLRHSRGKASNQIEMGI